MGVFNRRFPALLVCWLTAAVVLGLGSGTPSSGSMCAHAGEVGASRSSSPTRDQALLVTQPDLAALAAAAPAGSSRLFARCAMVRWHVPASSTAAVTTSAVHDPADPGLTASGQPRPPPQSGFAS